VEIQGEGRNGRQRGLAQSNCAPRMTLAIDPVAYVQMRQKGVAATLRYRKASVISDAVDEAAD
jgi:hypothetical protein